MKPDVIEPAESHEHEWIVYIWEYNYAGIQSLKPLSMKATSVICVECAEIMRIPNEQSKETV